MSVTVDTSGFRRKMQNIANLREAMKFIHQDAASWFKIKLTNEIINGQFVGVISGNLKDSYQDIEPRSTVTRTVIRQDTQMAPYAPYVSNWSRWKYGKTYMELAKFFHGPAVLSHAVEEFKRAIKLINAGNIYKYQNPYPIA